MAIKEFHDQITAYNRKLAEVKKEIKKVVVGQDRIIDAILKCLVCNGHALIEGGPGIAKTLIVVVLNETITGATFQRIQFTPDLLPTDITGVTAYEQDRGFYTVKGPIFANIVVGDEINRTPPKVQSSMLQAMQEREVTIGKETFPLPKPFIVMATQDPLETRGVYPLPEAQIDRFFFKLSMSHPEKAEEINMIEANLEVKKLEDFGVKQVISLDTLLEMQKNLKNIYLSEEIKKYIVHIVNATRRPNDYGIKEGRYMRWGGSPRASINLSIAAKATAMMNNRTFVMPEDVRAIAHEVLRHRVILNYEGKAKGIGTDQIVTSIIGKVPVL
ncbi:MAG: MoxR family ATPase [Candidatus Altiarchaeota archaeon]|nr:MoxR family ATPase [Candidatus Altiarchaeota archaeon]